MYEHKDALISKQLQNQNTSTAQYSKHLTHYTHFIHNRNVQSTQVVVAVVDLQT